jgi:uncharacterized membrane protein YdjX (TVP38/TMEM64 family)
MHHVKTPLSPLLKRETKVEENSLRRGQFAIGAGIILLVIAIAIAWLLLPIHEWVQPFQSWIQGLGIVGALAFAAMYILAVILLAPAELMSIMAGLIFGFWGGPLVIVAATVGAALAFLVSRYAVRDRVIKLVRNRPLLQAVDAAVREESWKIVLLLRLNPLVPFNLQNYFFGATQIGFWPYTAATFIGIMPGATFYVYIGAIGGAATMTRSYGSAHVAILAIGLAATAIVLFIISRKAKAKLSEVGVDQKSEHKLSGPKAS